MENIPVINSQPWLLAAAAVLILALLAALLIRRRSKSRSSRSRAANGQETLPGRQIAAGHSSLTGKPQPIESSGEINSLDTTLPASNIRSTENISTRPIKTVQAPAGSPALEYRSGRRTHIGMQRTVNEDAVLVLESNRNEHASSLPRAVYVVADGMGGHKAGEVASKAIVDFIVDKASQEFFSSQGAYHDAAGWLQETASKANRAVYDLRQSAGTDMGSTLVMAVLDGDQAAIGHAGDSRAYLIRGQEIRQLTVDHTLVERLVAAGQITRQEARRHPQRNVIYRTMGDKPAVEIDLNRLTLAPGDRLLLCSDGLSGKLEDQDIFQIVQASASPQAACDALIAAANAAGGDDNITAVLVELVRS